MKRRLRRGLLVGVSLAALAGAGQFGWHYWTVGRFEVSTDDAYVKADSTTIAPKVSGYIAQVLVEDNQPVKAGQVLARIDERDFRTAVDQARAEVAAAEAAIRNLDAQIVLQRSVIEQGKADIAASKAGLAFAQADHTRYQNLMRTGYGTVQRAELADSTLREKTAQLARAQAGLVAAQSQVDVLATERAQAAAQADRARALARQAELNLGYTAILAPVDGSVGARTLRVGQYVQAGTQLMAVVPLDAVYVVANFKETQLAHVRNGQKVSIEVDGLPDATLSGRVDSLAPASGQEFALLPPDNATGNFTKVVQRIPVKIVLDAASRQAELLRPGMSVVPTIDTKALLRSAATTPAGRAG